MSDEKPLEPESIDSKDKYITPTPRQGADEDLQIGDMKDNASNYDAVFGELTQDGPIYRSIGWYGTIVLMLKTQIGLGILSIPSVFNILGIVPGAILLSIVAALACWTSIMVGKFKLNHREVYGFDDAAGLIFGRVGREVVIWIHLLAFLSIGLNAVSNHAACTAIFVLIAALIGFLFSSIRTLGRITWIALLESLSLSPFPVQHSIPASPLNVLTVTIAVGVQNGPSTAPQGWVSDYNIVNKPSVADGVSAISTLIFACSATPGYFSIVAEMRDPRYFTRAAVISQFVSTLIYFTIGIVVYYYCGSMVASPALGSAGHSMKRISYGVTLPGLLASTTIFLHYPSKYVFLRLLRGSAHLTSNSFTHWATWLGCTFGCTIFAYIIASGIPVFSHLISLIGALLGFLLAYQPAGCMWFYWTGCERNGKWVTLACWSVFLIATGSFITVTGTYGSIVSIIDALASGEATRP
ncbi:hypothetical protein N7488_010800 [Penicillium malachiteum]|nr:hypothetical protein N7488_010800 [Penicillium malachiteum]